MFFVGDLKTVERAQNVQLEHRDSEIPSKQFEGFIPALADFHTYGNFLGVSKFRLQISLQFRQLENYYNNYLVVSINPRKYII